MKLTGLTIFLAGSLALPTAFTDVKKNETQNVSDFSYAQTFRDEEPAERPDIGSDKGYSAVVYNNRNGLPTSEANDIAQTSEGFIWIGSYSGLVRYDGNTFERYDSTTGIANVGNLLVDKKDRLWIGTNDSGIAVMEKGEVRMWNEDDGLGSLNINMITEDHDGCIYVGTANGVYLFDNDLNLKEIDDPRISNLYIDVLNSDSEGTVYGVSSEDDIFTIKEGKVTSYYPSGSYHLDGVLYILPDPNVPGNVYIGTDDSRFYYGRIENGVKIQKEYDISPLFGVMNIEYIYDTIWISGRNGIGFIDDEEFYFLDDYPLNNSVGSIMVDYEGNFWFTSTRQGVMKIVPNEFRDIFEKYNLEERVVNTTCFMDGNLFIGTDTGLIIVNEEEGALTEFPLNSAQNISGEPLESTDLLELLDGCRIRAMLCDSQNRLWISTWRAVGLLCYDNGNLTSYTDKNGLVTNHLRGLAERQDGAILVSMTGGVCVVKDGKVIASYAEKDGLTNPEALTVCGAPNGDIIVGTDGRGICIFTETGVKSLTTRDGLSSGIIMRVKYDENRHVYWIVTSNSLAYMTEDYQITTIKNFPYSNNFDLYENKFGDMWVLSSNGIYVLPAEDMIENGELSPIHYSMENGLPFITTANSYSTLTENGDLYIAGNAGVSKVNIDTPMENVLDLKVAVPFLDVDGKRIYPDGNGDFRLSSDVHKVTINSYVFNYALSNPTVAYKLEGFDSDYIKMSRSELKPVDYTNLPGGNYEFNIQLMDSQEITGKTVSVKIIKEKSLFEQQWFYMLALFGFIAINAAAATLYIRRKTQMMEEKNREEVQKERLATELKTAGQIQEGVLPHNFPPFPEYKEFDIYASMDPAREVGGDFYDFFLIDEDHLCLVMADVSGKGIPASLFMMVSKAILESHARHGIDAGEILKKTNDAICSSNNANMFVTVWIGILEISTGKITAANAGHEYPALMQDGVFSLMKDKHGFVIGGMEGMKYKSYEFTMKPGDKLFLYTDGVPEATAADNTMFGTDRMIEALNRSADASVYNVLAEVRRSVDEFVQDAEQFDDLTMMCIVYNGKKED